TGIKEGDPQKVMNITTRRDKSVLNRGNFNAGVGTNERYQANGSLTRINGNQQMGLNAGWNKSQLGAGGGMPSMGMGPTISIGNPPGIDFSSSRGGGYTYSSGMSMGGGGGIGTNSNGSIRVSHNDHINKKMRSD